MVCGVELDIFFLNHNLQIKSVQDKNQNRYQNRNVQNISIVPNGAMPEMISELEDHSQNWN
jgi:hypothetical protein